MHIHLLYTYLNIIPITIAVHPNHPSLSVESRCFPGVCRFLHTGSRLSKFTCTVDLIYLNKFRSRICWLLSFQQNYFKKSILHMNFQSISGSKNLQKGWPPEESSQWASDLWYMPLSTNSSAQLHSLSPKHIPTAGMEGNSSFSVVQNQKRNKNTCKATYAGQKHLRTFKKTISIFKICQKTSTKPSAFPF